MFVSAYITAKDRKEARKIALLLVKNRLAACANIFPVESFYWWDGKIQNENEYAIIAKTQKKNIKKLISNVKRIHSYSVPCIVSWPIAEGSRDYLEWVKKETI
jgi:periplasmic divalent cation tolerance protein